MAHTYKIPRLTDLQIASALKTLSEEFARMRCSLQVSCRRANCQ